jgi:hypothetical protein
MCVLARRKPELYGRGKGVIEVTGPDELVSRLQRARERMRRGPIGSEDVVEGRLDSRADKR